jgi:hypothetical protein
MLTIIVGLKDELCIKRKLQVNFSEFTTFLLKEAISRHMTQVINSRKWSKSYMMVFTNKLILIHIKNATCDQTSNNGVNNVNFLNNLHSSIEK